MSPSAPRSHPLTAATPTAGGGSAALEPRRQLRSLLVLAIASRTRTDSDLDRLASEHAATVFQGEDDLDRTSGEAADARTEAHELEQVCHPLSASCTHHHHQSSKPSSQIYRISCELLLLCHRVYDDASGCFLDFIKIFCVMRRGYYQAWLSVRSSTQNLLLEID